MSPVTRNSTYLWLSCRAAARDAAAQAQASETFDCSPSGWPGPFHAARHQCPIQTPPAHFDNAAAHLPLPHVLPDPCLDGHWPPFRRAPPQSQQQRRQRRAAAERGAARRPRPPLNLSASRPGAAPRRRPPRGPRVPPASGASVVSRRRRRWPASSASVVATRR